jgi:hypothetical protein
VEVANLPKLTITHENIQYLKFNKDGTDGTITYKNTDAEFTFQLKLGALDDVSERSGAKTFEAQCKLLENIKSARAEKQRAARAEKRRAARAEKQRLALEAEKQRLSLEAEEQRLAKEKAEKKRIAKEKAEEKLAEEKRLAEEQKRNDLAEQE